LFRSVPEVLKLLAFPLFTWALILLPLALYLLYLGGIVNRRQHPFMVRGDVSSGGVLLALVGFFLIGPPSWVVEPFKRWGPEIYWTAYAIYVLLACFLLWGYLNHQRQYTMIYNLNPEMLPSVVRGALDELKLPYQATAGRIALGDGHLVLEVEASAAWYNAVLTWLGPNREMRGKIEGRLRENLTNVTTDDNPCRVVLLLWGFALLAFCFFSFLVYYWHKST
jgi:hypothetical protein